MDKTDHQNSHRYLHCPECAASRGVRAEWGCGHLPAAERTGTFPGRSEWPRVDSDICPGYLIALPQIGEAIRAHSWWTRGELGTLLGGELPTPVAIDAIDILQSEVGALESWAIRQRTRPEI
jgi:hypothetical protein